MTEEKVQASDAVSKRLDVLIAIALRNARGGEAKTKEDATFLSSFGLERPEIATILGMTPNAITKAMGRAKNR